MVDCQRYDKFSIFLHWSMALLLVLQLGLGVWMLELPKGGDGQRAYWFNMHKSLGMLLGILGFIRLAWSIRRPFVRAHSSPPFIQALANFSHRLLYLLIVALPVTGFLGSAFSGYPIRFFGVLLPKLSERWDGGKDVCSLMHQGLSYGLMALVAMHLLAVAYHQIMLKESLIRRMI